MNLDYSPNRTVIILVLLSLGMILTAGCVSDLVVKKNLVIFRMNETGVQESAIPILIDYPRYDSYLSRPPVGLTCDGGLLVVNNYFTILPGPSGKYYDNEYRHWFRIDKIGRDNRIEWEMTQQALHSHPVIETIRENTDGFIVTTRDGEILTLERHVPPDPTFSTGKCPDLIYPETAETETDATGKRILAGIPNSSSSGLHTFPSSYVYLHDSSSRDWNGLEKEFWNLFRFTGISNVRDDGFTIEVKLFNSTGSLQSENSLRWQPATRAEKIDNCEYTIRSVPAVYQTHDGGYFVVGDLRCFN
jgi:hypothetical protein